jgi:hypothetical protein
MAVLLESCFKYGHAKGKPKIRRAHEISVSGFVGFTGLAAIDSSKRMAWVRGPGQSASPGRKCLRCNKHQHGLFEKPIVPAGFLDRGQRDARSTKG